MRVLLSNDDGIHAPGIVALHKALTQDHEICDEVMVAAPLTVQSATSHGVTFSTPLMTAKATINDDQDAIAVDGRPADCVKLALSTLWPKRHGDGSLPDLVISGMNAGANCGINVIYSGTVAAALEAAFLGVPSIAVSLHLGKGAPNWDRGAQMANRAIRAVMDAGLGKGGLLDRHACVNINIPISDDLADPPTPDEPEIVVCPMNTHGLVDRYEQRATPWGAEYFWSVADGLDFHGEDEGTDVERLFKRCITVTPLGYDLTKQDRLAGWRDAMG